MVRQWIYGIAEGERVAIKHDEELALTIGGYARNRIFIEEIIETFFEREVPVPKKPQKNKLRYELRCDWSAYRRALAKIAEAGLSVVVTRSHEREMS